MLVFGDRIHRADPAEMWRGIQDEQRAVAALPAGIVRHGRLAGLLIEMGRLWQGLADAEFEDHGRDRLSAVQKAASETTLALARTVWDSWRGAPGPIAPLFEARMPPLPHDVGLKTPEGYAFYALYPETYAEAAEAFARRRARVVGLRSIGTSLAAMAAAAVDAPPPLTLRPSGPPFRRRLSVSRDLVDRVKTGPGDIVVVDEGPGLSGSSFGATADLLADAGVAEERLLFLPSHGGEPGPQADPRHLGRWRRARRGLKTFDEVVLPRLPSWVQDLTGEALAPLEDLSGGAWRRNLAPRPPSWTGQERRKLRLRTERGTFLLKFTGLGEVGRAKLARAEALGAAGYGPRPLGWRHGFLVEPWLEGRSLDRSPVDRTRLVDRLAAYIAFRARAFPAAEADGASLDQLADMARVNIAEGLGPDAQELCARLDRLLAEAPAPRPIRTDNRMHAWEWLALSDGRLIKTDALDHDDAHDLIGCQDAAWDVTGAEAAFDLAPEESARLLRTLACGGVEPAPSLLAFLRVAYAAFQLGYWTFAAAQTGGDDADLNAREARRWADRLAGRRARR